MTTITIEAIDARQTELAQLIEQFKQQASRTISVPAINVALQPGEHYAGQVLNEDGAVKHHLVLMAARPDGRLDWHKAVAWAGKVGGSLPDRQEQALLFANCKPHLEPAWHWSSETAGESYAWYCKFNDGDQDYDDRSSEGSAVAVRRF